MPTYDYQCQSCGHEFELFQNITDDPIRKCPECGKAVKRLIGAGAAVIFKGPGFYATDYRKGGSGRAPSCGRDTPCCGRDTPCDKSP